MKSRLKFSQRKRSKQKNRSQGMLNRGLQNRGSQSPVFMLYFNELKHEKLRCSAVLYRAEHQAKESVRKRLMI